LKRKLVIPTKLVLSLTGEWESARLIAILLMFIWIPDFSGMTKEAFQNVKQIPPVLRLDSIFLKSGTDTQVFTKISRRSTTGMLSRLSLRMSTIIF
jgi:hypothetical protein